MALRFKPGNLHSIFHLPLSLCLCRNYSRHIPRFPDPILDSVREQCRLGFSSTEIPLSIFHQLNSLRPLPSVTVFNQLLTAMSKIEPDPPFSAVVTLYNQLELSGLRPDSHSVGVLAKCYRGLGRVDFAFSVMGKGLKLGYPPNIAILTTLLNGLIDSDKLYHAIQLLDKIVKLGMQPDGFTYVEMLQRFCRSQDYSCAYHLRRLMEVKPLFNPNPNPNPNHAVYNTIVDSLYKDGLFPLTLDYLKERKDKGILPNVWDYTNLLNGLRHLGHWDDAKELVPEMLDNNFAPNIKTYTALVDMYCKEGNVTEARALFEFMTERGVRAKIIIYNTLLNGYCLRGEMEKTENLLDVMVENSVKPNVVTFNTLINGYCKSFQVDKALEMFNGMHLKGTHITPNVFTYNTMINALCKDERFQLAFQLFEDMKHRGVAPNVSTYSSLLDNLWRDDEQIYTAISLSKEMKNRGLNPCIRT